jgi:hypothetical protein
MLLCAALLATACGGGGNATPTPSPSTGSDDGPTRDLIDLARRLRGVDVPRVVAIPAPAVGDQVTLDVISFPPGGGGLPSYRGVPATLRAISDHAYFFIANAADIPDAEVQDAARAFEDRVWPAVTGAFGQPPIPGVDGDPRIYIFHGDLGEGLGGYVSTDDAFPRAAVAHSNGREALYINAGIRPLGSDGYAHVVAHEFQHLIHQRLDLGEDTWVNEGLSQYASGLLGQESDYAAFLDKPDTQLNAWSSLDSSVPHYDAASLFMAYLLEQAGGTGGELAAQPGDSVEGVRQYLQKRASGRSFEEMAGDWAVANYLDEPQGPYGYRARELSDPATTIAKPGSGSGDVHQFGTDYLQMDAADFSRPPVFDFQGDAQVPVLGAEGAAKGAFWWSGLGDSMDATLTREVDLSKVDTATLSFRLWFDVERWFDYGFVEVSTDGGATWKALDGQQTSTQDPLGVAYGAGYTGQSGGGDRPAWVDERIDLTPYAGKKALLRFEYLTDDSNHGEGLAIDDVAVPEIGFLDDASSDPGGWLRAGFRLVTEPLAQRFELRLITMGPAPAVESIALDASNHARIDLAGLGADYQRAIIAVVGATDGTEQQTHYRYQLTSRGGTPEGGSP